ncbi:MAG: hypothetical protein JWR47_2720, partial [Phenylobacterium sp.]|nr:hypothetical protein [Phenylobacterium sp.]
TVTGNSVSSDVVNLQQAGGADNVNFVLGPNTTIPTAAIGDVSLLNTWLAQHTGTSVVEPAVYAPPPAVVEPTSYIPSTGGVEPGVVDLTGSALDAATQDVITKAVSNFFTLHHDWAIL